MTQMEVYKMEGIRDLPFSVRVPFGKAWLAEHEGRTEEAEYYLNQAVEAEARNQSNA